MPFTYALLSRGAGDSRNEVLAQVTKHEAAWDWSNSTPGPDAPLAAGVLPREQGAGAESWCDSRGDDPAVRLFPEPYSCDSEALRRLTDGLTALPKVGDEFAGFRLIGELGSGTFGRVYLARQGDLADRPVALKVSTGCFAESQKLARLQHTNIVPVYSFHRAGDLQAVCMPYFGSTTLGGVLDDLGQRRTLPASGKGLVSTLTSRRNRSGVRPAVAPVAPVAPSRIVEGRPEPAADGPATLTTLRMLEGLTYVEAALWIGGRLAEGLAHAHDRGVLHRDLKPANVLLTDEGQPMLLDFNLSENIQAAGAAGARVGGTLPYMAPEHLTAYLGRPAVVDARSDLYSLGVLLYELLTGRCPFEKPGGPLERVLPIMIEDRLRPPPSARSLNPGATPAVESILRRCLEPDPARRYQTARELQEDLDRQRLHQPLRYAADPSPRERVAKWLKRNPRAVSVSRVGTAAVVLLALLTAGLYWRGEQVAKYEATARLSGFRDDLNTARLLLGARAADVDQLERGPRGRPPRPRPLPGRRRRPLARAAVGAPTSSRGKGSLTGGSGRTAGAANRPRGAAGRPGRRRPEAAGRTRRGVADESARGKVLSGGSGAAGLVAQRARAGSASGPRRRGAGVSANGPRRRRCATTGTNTCWRGSRRGAAGWRMRRSGCGRWPSRSRPTSPCSS